MLRLILLIVFYMSFSHIALSQVQKDSVFFIIRNLINSKVHVTRTQNLDAAAKFHAEYLVLHKASGHLQVDSPNTKTPMRRAEKFGDYGLGVYEVCWSGTMKYKNLPNTPKDAIMYFKISDKHWDIMTRAMSERDTVRFGYSLTMDKDWAACVIIYSTGPQVKLDSNGFRITDNKK
jgi:hypothetical protein